MFDFRQLLTRAPPDATSKELRALGWKGAVLGAPIFALGAVWFSYVDAFFPPADGEHVPSRFRGFVTASPAILGYAILMLGLSRLVFGARPARAGSSWAAGRILFWVFASWALFTVTAVIAFRTPVTHGAP